MAIEHDSQKSGRSSNGRVMINEGGYQHLLSAIYDLVFTPTDWPIVLRLLAEGLNCSVRRLDYHDPGTGYTAFARGDRHHGGRPPRVSAHLAQAQRVRRSAACPRARSDRP